MASLICLLIGFVMWVLAYGLVLARSFRRVTYGMSIVAICFNLSWDVTFALLRDSDLLSGISDPFIDPLKLNSINRIFCTIWAAADIVMMYQVIRNGRENTSSKCWNRHIYLYIIALLTFGVIGIYLSANIFRTPADHCLILGLGVTEVVSLSYVFMALSRTNFRGQSLSSALLRLVGIQLICITLIHVIRVPIMLTFMVVFLVTDLAYIGLLDRWCHERRVSIWTLL